MVYINYAYKLKFNILYKNIYLYANKYYLMLNI